MQSTKKILLTLPPTLVHSVKRASLARTKSEAVVIALEEYLRDKKASRLLSRFGRGFGLSSKRFAKIRKPS